MDVLARIFSGGGLRAEWAPDDDRWGYEPQFLGASLGTAGTVVTAEQAQKISAWYRGRDILATVLAMLPFPVYRRLPNDGGSETAPDHPLYDVLHDRPNDWPQDSFQWRRQKMFHLIDHGNGYDWIRPGPRGIVDQLVPIHPTLVTPELLASGRKVFRVRDEKTGRSTTHTTSEIFHLCGASDDGIQGKGVLAYARESLSLGLVLDQYASKLFTAGSLSGGAIEVPGVLDEPAARRMAQSYVTAAGKWHLPKILEQGAKWVSDSKGMTPEDAQMLLSRKFSIDEMARWLGVPRQMLENSDPSFGNAEQFDQNFITYSLGGWLSLFEFAANGQLVLERKKYFVEFTRDAVARGKLLDRWNVHVAAVNAGIKTVDEARAKEGLNKRGGKADELREPQNITGKPTVPITEPTPAPQRNRPPEPEPAKRNRAEAIVEGAAAKTLRKEMKAVSGMATAYADTREGFASQVHSFYRAHARYVEDELQMSTDMSRAYCDGQAAQAIEGGLRAVEIWGTPDYTAWLVTLALEDVA